jgi:hypothetical protein
MKKVIYGLCVIIVFVLILLWISSEKCHAGVPSDSLTYLGNAFVKIKTAEGTIIYIDPYAVNATDSADMVLITHEHNDHNDLTRVIQKTGCQIIRVANALQDGVYHTFTIGSITITAVPAYGEYHPKTDGVGFIVEFNGIKVYHAGGTGKIPEMADLAGQNISYSLLPLTVGAAEMTQAAAMIRARHDIPFHSYVSTSVFEYPAVVAQFQSPNRLTVHPGHTIALTSDTTAYIGQILRVPQEYPTIQAAIDTAQDADTVLVSEGTYYENISYRGKGIVVTSNYYTTHDWQTVLNTIINGSTGANKNTASTVQFLWGEYSTAVLDGFTITGGTGSRYLFPNGTGSAAWHEGAGIILHYSSAIIRNNYIVGNTTVPQPGTTNGGGGGIASMYGNPLIYNNVIVSNTAGYAGGIVLNWSGGTIKNNIIYHNTGGSSAGNGGVMLWRVPQNAAFVENNTIVGNRSLTDAGGINIMLENTASVPVVRNNIVWANSQAIGGQVTSPGYSSYNNIEDYSGGTNFSASPQLQEGSFLLSTGSPCIDAGDTASACSDIEDPVTPGMALSPSKGTVRNDVGAYGGFFATVFPSLNVRDLVLSAATRSVTCAVGQTVSASFILRNVSTIQIVLGSVTHSNPQNYSLNKDLSEKLLGQFEPDTIVVTFAPVAAGTFTDTVKIYHSLEGVTNPLTIVITGRATGGTTDIQQGESKEYKFQLFQNYPNPFNPSTEIGFDLPSTSFVTLTIFDVMGREVKTLVSENLRNGHHSYRWDATGMANGIYFYQLRAGTMTVTKRLLLIK